MKTFDMARAITRRVLLAGLAVALPLLASAQPYPAKPVKIVVGYAAGGAVGGAKKRRRTTAAVGKKKRRRTGGATSRSLDHLQKEARRLGIALSKEGHAKNKAQLSRAIAYHKS